MSHYFIEITLRKSQTPSLPHTLSIVTDFFFLLFFLYVFPFFLVHLSKCDGWPPHRKPQCCSNFSQLRTLTKIALTLVCWPVNKKNTIKFSGFLNRWILCFHQIFFECLRNTPHDLYHLELVVTPMSSQVKIRRHMFLHHILIQEEQSLLYKFFMA